MNSGASKQPLKTIGEVASELGLAQHVLRFWETKFPHIKPHKRRGGHRYYRIEDIQALKEIKSLLYEQGYTIKGAAQYLKEQKYAPKSEHVVQPQRNEGVTFSVAEIAERQQHKEKEQEMMHELQAVLQKLFTLKKRLYAVEL